MQSGHRCWLLTILDFVDKCWHSDPSVEAAQTVDGDRRCCCRCLTPSEDGRFEALTVWHNHVDL